ncbi:uncharacterized protein LOC143034375 isoform X2 [Oratosquilla oratoria]|uniref:uncharacterized protein LOC143034375 isoform X2 n=1 Tax=Oratosquilla oratoria TaxID=337810 RepID=UPI003F766D6C
MLRSAYDWLATKATSSPSKSGNVENDVDNESCKENSTCNGQTPLNCNNTPKMNKVKQANPSPWGYTIAPRPTTSSPVNIQTTPITKTTPARPNLSWDELSFAAEVLSPGFANRIVKDVKNQSQRSPDLRRQYPTAQDRYVRAGVIPNVRLGGRPKVVLSPSRNTSPLLPLTRSASFSRRMSTDFLSSGTPRMPEIRSVTSILDTSNDTKELVSDPTSVEAVVAALHQTQAGKGVKRPRFAEAEDLNKRAKCSSSSGSSGLPGATTIKYSRDQEEDQVVAPCTGGGGEKRGREASPSVSPENKRYCIADPMLASFSSSRHMQEYNSSQRLNRDSPISTYDSRRETDSESNKSLDSRNSKASDLYQQQDELVEDGATATPSPWDREASDPSSGSHTPHSSNSAPQGISTTSTTTTSRSSTTSSRAPTPRNPTPPRPTHIITLEAHKVDKVKNQHRLNKMLNILFHLSDEEKSQERAATPQEKSESTPTSEPSTSSAEPVPPPVVSTSVLTTTTTSASTILSKPAESVETSNEDSSKTEVTESFTYVLGKGSQSKGKSEETKVESEIEDGNVSASATIKLCDPQTETAESPAVTDDTPATDAPPAAEEEPPSTSVTADENGTDKSVPPPTADDGIQLSSSASIPQNPLLGNGGSKPSDTVFSGFNSAALAEKLAGSSNGEKQNAPSLGSPGFTPATQAGSVVPGAGFFSAIASKTDNGKESSAASTAVSTPALFSFNTATSTSTVPPSSTGSSTFTGFGAPVSEATTAAISADSSVEKTTSSTEGEIATSTTAAPPPYTVPSSLSNQALGGFGLGLFQAPSSSASQAASGAGTTATSTAVPSINTTTAPNSSAAITFGTSAPQQAESGSIFGPQAFTAAPSSTPSFGTNPQGTTSCAPAFTAAPSSTPSFGTNPQGTTSSAPAFSSQQPPTSTAAPAGSNLFSFGATKAPALESSTPSGVFAFGQSSMAASTASASITSSVTAVATPSVAPGLITFGGGQSAAPQGTGASPAIPSFKATVASTAAVPKESTGFSFGGAAATATTAAETGTQSSSVFAFGSGKTEAAAATAPSVFAFGGSTAAGAKPSTGFSFQAATPTTAAPTFGSAPERKASTGFAFCSATAATTTTVATAFGASTTAITTSASPSFAFGASANTAAPTTGAFSFGSGSSSSNPAVGFGAQKTGAAFGSNPSSFTPPFSTPVTNSTPAFGSSSFPAATTSPFGSSTAPASNPFSPAAPAAPPTFADIKSPTPSFGSSAAGFGTQGPAFGSSPFGGAAPAPAAGDKPQAASPFQFGQSSSSTNAPFAFGGQNNPPAGGEQTAGGNALFNFGQAQPAGTNPGARRRVRPRRHR